jgi:hypothetical protein
MSIALAFRTGFHVVGLLAVGGVLKSPTLMSISFLGQQPAEEGRSASCDGGRLSSCRCRLLFSPWRISSRK